MIRPTIIHQHKFRCRPSSFVTDLHQRRNWMFTLKIKCVWNFNAAIKAIILNEMVFFLRQESHLKDPSSQHNVQISFVPSLPQQQALNKTQQSLHLRFPPDFCILVSKAINIHQWRCNLQTPRSRLFRSLSNLPFIQRFSLLRITRNIHLNYSS